MFTKEEIKAMAWGYGFAVPLGIAAIYFGAGPIAIAPLFMVGFCITLFQLNR